MNATFMICNLQLAGGEGRREGGRERGRLLFWIKPQLISLYKFLAVKQREKMLNN